MIRAQHPEYHFYQKMTGPIGDSPNRFQEAKIDQDQVLMVAARNFLPENKRLSVLASMLHSLAFFVPVDLASSITVSPANSTRAEFQGSLHRSHQLPRGKHVSTFPGVETYQL